MYNNYESSLSSSKEYIGVLNRRGVLLVRESVAIYAFRTVLAVLHTYIRFACAKCVSNYTTIESKCTYEVKVMRRK